MWISRAQVKTPNLLLWSITSPSILFLKAIHIFEFGIKGQGIRLCFLCKKLQIPRWEAWMEGGGWNGPINTVNLPYQSQRCPSPKLESYLSRAPFPLHHSRVFGSGHFKTPVYWLPFVSSISESSTMTSSWWVLVAVEYVTGQNQQRGMGLGVPQRCAATPTGRDKDFSSMMNRPSTMRPFLVSLWELPHFLWL